MREHAYLQHGQGTNGPFLTEHAPMKFEAPDNYYVRFDGRWRKVHMNLKSLWIMYRGKRINVLIEGI